MDTKAGYAAIIGKPNSGKSTLLNAILGCRLSIVTPKPQTTRKNIPGIYTGENFQIVFLDTPGLLSPKYTMQKLMMEYVVNSIEEADVLIAVIDLEKFQKDGIAEEILTMSKSTDKPVIAVINKVDLLKDRKNVLPVIEKLVAMKIFKEVIPISALKEMNVEHLIETVSRYLPEHEFYYDEDMLSTLNERFFVSEIIRENIFMLTKDELPYSVEVSVVEFKERSIGKWFINAEIIVERETQKRILIGHNGSLIKEIGEKSRKQIEVHLQQEVFLELFVKVRTKWRDDACRLRSFGY